MVGKQGNKAVVLISGGIDSTTTLYWAHREYKEVVALSIFYQQRHKKEYEYAHKHAERLGLEHYVMELPFLAHECIFAMVRSFLWRRCWHVILGLMLFVWVLTQRMLLMMLIPIAGLILLAVWAQLFILGLMVKFVSALRSLKVPRLTS